jgi:glutathione S-transferase
VLRFWRTWGGLHNKRPDEIAQWTERGQQALQVMESHLRDRAFFVGERCTIADIALYAYTHTADWAGFDMEPVPAVRSWLARMAAEPGHVSIANGPGSPDFRPER